VCPQPSSRCMNMHIRDQGSGIRDQRIITITIIMITDIILLKRSLRPLTGLR